MKNDNTSKISDKSNQLTVFCGEEISNSPLLSKNGIRLKYSDNTFSHYDISTLSCINPIFFAKLINKPDKDILLPSYITPNLLLEFLFIVKNGFNDLDDDSTLDNTQKILSLIQVSDFFQNESITIQLIREIVMNRLNSDNSFEYLQYSYEKLNNIRIDTNSPESECVWFDLFYKCLETIGMQPFSLLKHNDIIEKLDSKVLYELLQKCFAHLILGNYILIEDDESNNSIDTYRSNDNDIEGENYFESINDTTSQQSKKNKKMNNNANGNINDNKTGKSIDKDKIHLNEPNCKDKNNVVVISIPRQQTIGSKSNFATKKNIEQLIKYLYKVYQCNNNFFSLLTFEYLTIISNNSLKELGDSPNPTFDIQIPYDIDSHFYEEYFIDLTINNKRVIIVIYYHQSEDSLNVAIKLGEKAQSDQRFAFQIFSFASIVKLNDDSTLPNSVQTSLTSLSNNKSMHCIFKFSNFKSRFKQTKANIDSKNCIFKREHKYSINQDGMINNENNQMSYSNEDDEFNDDNENENDEGYDYNYFKLRVYLKLSFIHSVLASFLLQNFSVLAYQPEINKLSKQLFILVLKNKYLNKQKEDDVVNALVNWLDDEINSKEDITSILEKIQWKNVSEELLFVFIMKYAYLINIELFEEKVIKSIEEKYNINSLSCSPTSSPSHSSGLKSVLLSVFNAAKQVDYNSLYTKMNKDLKMNMVNNSNNTCKSNIGTSDLTSGMSNDKKYSLSAFHEYPSSKNAISIANNTNTSNKCPEHLSKLYQSKEVNTINKFILTHNKKENMNSSPPRLNKSKLSQQGVSVQSSTLTQFLANHTQKKSKTQLKYFSPHNTGKNNTGSKKMSHLQYFSLQIPTKINNGLNSNHNEINKTTPTNSNTNNNNNNRNIIYLRNGNGDSDNSNYHTRNIDKKMIISKSFSKRNDFNTRNVPQSKDLITSQTVNKKAIEKNKDRSKETTKNIPKNQLTSIENKHKKINLFLKAKPSPLSKK